MFWIYDPDEMENPFLVTEWIDGYEDFVRLADANHLFLVEVWTPTEKRAAVVVNGKIKHTQLTKITYEHYRAIADAGTIEDTGTATTKTNVGHKGKA